MSKASITADLYSITSMTAQLNVSIKAGHFNANAQGHFKSAVAELEKLEGALISQLATFDIDDSIEKLSLTGVISILLNHGVDKSWLAYSREALNERLRDLVLSEEIDEVELLIVLSGE